ncbi:MAG: protein-export rane protein SecD, partial [Bacilli bacterium]|nr:protein-export rane protein SecD [Bacilli bacterium]
MNKKLINLVVFFVIVFFMVTTMILSTTRIINHLKLGLDLKGGFEILYLAAPIDAGGVITSEDLRETAHYLITRIDPTGTMEPEISPEGKDRIRAKIAGIVDETKIRELLQKPSNLSFRGPDGRIMLNGSDFVPNGAALQYKDSEPIVSIKLKNAKKFEEITTALLGQRMGIYMDDTLISNPNVPEVISSDTATIRGGPFTVSEAMDLIKTINMGALPLKLTEKYTQKSVGATLGQKSLNETVNAGLIALVLIIVGMIGFYRVPGFIASVTLITYTWMLLLVFCLLNATLTLPGIAAFVLGVGMAVDANIITYERIKEEMRSGKSIL